MLTKSDYLSYLDAPMHLWARLHDQFETQLTDYDRHLLEQGIKVHKVADEFLQNYVAAQAPNAQYSAEHTYSDGRFQARIDGLVYDQDAAQYDLYEVKSSTAIRPVHIHDLAFQRLAAESEHNIRHVYLVHMNKEYTRAGEIELDQLFVVENLDQRVEDIRQETLYNRQLAYEVSTQATPEGIEACANPKTCPCPSLCHPDLPAYSIYNLPRLSQPKKRALKEQGILAIQDIPADFKLSAIQQLHAQAVKTGQPIIDHAAIQAMLEQLVYPLYFLDYETFNPAVPQYDGYHPHQHMVFQYSLHVFHSQTSKPDHFEFLATQPGDPSRQLIEHLADNIGESGSVIVWNQAFEATRNKDMATLFPEYADLLLNVNARMFDLMKIFSGGHYVHADFKGSASIKAVLPVLVAGDSYSNLEINKGDQAMTAWAEIMRGQLTEAVAAQMKHDLLTYCQQDTWAMVENWNFLNNVLAAGA